MITCVVTAKKHSQQLFDVQSLIHHTTTKFFLITFLTTSRCEATEMLTISDKKKSINTALL